MSYLVLDSIKRNYHNHPVLNGLNLNLPKGKIYGFLARNGAGKTTTIRIILGLIKHHGGNLFIDGQNVCKNRPTVNPSIGSIIEYPGFYPYLSAKDNLKIFQLLYDKRDAKEITKLLSIVGLEHVGSKKVGSFSLGMKQRLGLARALLNDPELLILDEPTNGLDPSGIREMRHILKDLSCSYGKTILLSSHILSEIEQIVDLVGIMKDGKMLEESNINSLKDKCAKGYCLVVNQPKKAMHLLETKKGLTVSYNSYNDTIALQPNIDPGNINTWLIKHGFVVSQFFKSYETLEDYFLNITA